VSQSFIVEPVHRARTQPLDLPAGRLVGVGIERPLTSGVGEPPAGVELCGDQLAEAPVAPF